MNAVEILDGEVSLGVAIVGPDGKWSLKVDGLADGARTLTAREICTGVTSEKWDFTVDDRTYFEDFESAPLGAIPYGSTLDFGEVTVSNVYPWNGIGGKSVVSVVDVSASEFYAPYLTGKAIFIGTSSRSAVTLKFKTPVKTVKFGMASPRQDPFPLSIYSPSGEKLLYEDLQPHRTSEFGMWVSYTFVGSLIGEIEVISLEKSAGVYIDNITLSY